MTNVLIIWLKWDLKITPFLKEKVELLFCRLRTRRVHITRNHLEKSENISPIVTWFRIVTLRFVLTFHNTLIHFNKNEKTKREETKKLSVRVRDILIPDTLESRRIDMNRLSKNFDTTILNEVSNSFIFSFPNTENINTFSIIFISYLSSFIIYFFNIYYRKLTLADSPCRLLRK